MRRRQFVATALLSGSLSGCNGLQANGSPTESNDTADPSNGDSTETMTPDTDSSVKRRIELTNVELPPEDVPVSIGINILEDKVSADQTARLEFGFILTEKAHIRTDLEAPVGKTLSSDDTPGLVLLRPQDADEMPRVNDEMWKPDREQDEMWSFRSTAFESVLPANSLLTSELVLWADHRYDGYFEPGEYRFPHRFWVHNDEKVNWSFTIAVHEAD